jgi:hypothetical protein
MITKKKRSKGLASRPLWIITCYPNNRMKILTIDSEDDGGFSLPIFSFREEVETFLYHFEEQKQMKWRARQTTAGELISVLMAPSCASVKDVVLDPLPFSCSWARAALPFLSVSRERFVQELMMQEEEEEGSSRGACACSIAYV